MLVLLTFDKMQYIPVKVEIMNTKNPITPENISTIKETKIRVTIDNFE